MFINPVCSLCGMDAETLVMCPMCHSDIWSKYGHPTFCGIQCTCFTEYSGVSGTDNLCPIFPNWSNARSNIGRV